jgi:hypothetical protein
MLLIKHCLYLTFVVPWAMVGPFLGPGYSECQPPANNMQMDTGMVSMLEYDKDEGVPQGK